MIHVHLYLPRDMYIKACLNCQSQKDYKISFQYQLSRNAGQQYCRMLQGEHSATLLTFIKLPFVIKIFLLSIFEWPFYTGFTVYLFVHVGEDTDHEHPGAFLLVGFLVTYFSNYLSATVILHHLIVGIPRSSGGYDSPYTKLILCVSKSGRQPL